MKKTSYLFLFLLCCIFPKVYALSGDSTQVSLLTVMPRPIEVYTLFGHTAIRISNPSEHIDVVFNYGMFSFDEPGFVFRFIKGETDYSMDLDDYRTFYAHYALTNSTVVEQVLDIPAKDKENMIHMLSVNLQPENRKYRYNYFFDNCTTRPRDIIERFCGGKLVYQQPEDKGTFRKLVYECTGNYKWTTFGIDLLIGNGADSIISIRNEMFLPARLMNALDHAYTVSDSLPKHSIVASTKTIMKSDPKIDSKSTSSWNTPMTAGFILFILSLVLSIIGFIRKKTFSFFFCILFLIAGLSGCLIAFVSFISVHPCTWPNWNLLWIHPLYLIPAVGYLFKKTYKTIRWYHWSNFVILSLLLLGWSLIPQELNVACIPFILCLWVSSGYKLLIDKKLNR